MPILVLCGSERDLNHSFSGKLDGTAQRYQLAGKCLSTGKGHGNPPSIDTQSCSKLSEKTRTFLGQCLH